MSEEQSVSPKEDGANGPFLLSVDTDNMPGKLEMVFVRFERKLLDPEDFQFESKEFELLDPEHPYAKLIKDVLEVDP